MDPLTIPTGVLACISIALQAMVGLKQLKANLNVDGGSIGSAAIDLLASDMAGLRQVLQTMEVAYQDIEDDWTPKETGHAAAHWRDLRQCLNDQHGVLSDFVEMLFDLNKKVKIYAPSRMKSRLKSAAVRFVLVGQQVQAYKGAFQLSLEVLILSNSVSTQNPTPKPDSPVINQDVHRLMAGVDKKIQAVEGALAITRNTDNKTVDTVAMLKQCVSSALFLFSSTPTPTPADRPSKSMGRSLPRSQHDGAMDWTDSSLLDAVRLPTPPSEDSSSDRAPRQTTVAQLPKKPAHSAAVLTAPPTPADPLPSPANPPSAVQKLAVSRRTPAQLHPHHRCPPQQHPVPEPVFMYMMPVGWEGQKPDSNTPAPPPFPVQVVFGPPPAWSHQRPSSMQRPLVPFRPAPPSSKPASRHSHWPTISTTTSTSSLYSQAQPRRQHQLKPASQPPSTKEPTRQLSIQQMAPTPARVRAQSPSLKRVESSYGNSDDASELPPPTKQKQAKLQKQPRSSGKAVAKSEKGDKQQPQLADDGNNTRNRFSIGQPRIAKRRSQNPFGALKRLMPGSAQDLPQRQKLCFVGDSGCGKTCLLTALTKGTSPGVYEPTTFDKYVSNVEVRGVGPVELEIWDTAGQEAHDGLRSLAYPDSHALVLCFSIGDPSSYRNLLEKWLPEATRFCPGTPIFILGCKQDLRFDQKTIEKLQKSGQLPLTTAEGLATAGRINARYYIETSAKIGYGIENLLGILAEDILNTPRTEPVVNVTRRFYEDARLINEERRALRASGEILSPREWEYASKYDLGDDPNSTVWKLREEQMVVDKGTPSLRSSFFRKVS